MIYTNTKDALNWLINNPLEKLYVDEYGNYVIWGPYSNIIEYYRYIGGEEEGYDPWDFERLDSEEFIKRFDGEKLSTE